VRLVPAGLAWDRNEAVRELVPGTSSPDDVTVAGAAGLVPLDATYLRLRPGRDDIQLSVVSRAAIHFS
jgi:hypothetical protein